MNSSIASPSGRYAALTVAGGKYGRMRLVILDLSDVSKSTLLAEFDDEDIVNVQWVNDDRLVFQLSDLGKAVGERTNYGLMAVDREGKGSLKLLMRSNVGEFSRASQVSSGLVLPPWYRLQRVLRDGSNDVIVAKYLGDRNQELGQVDLFRLNTLTGRAVMLTDDAPEYAKQWVVDGLGRPRVVVTFNEDTSKVFWKATAVAPWALVREYETLNDKGRGIAPRGVSSDNYLFASGFAKPGDDTESLLRFDMSNVDATPQKVVSIEGYDFSGGFVTDSADNIKGIRYLSDAQGTKWLDPTIQKIQDEVDAKLPGLNNRIDCGRCDKPGTLLVASYSDRQPGFVSMYDSVSGKLTVLTKARPWIDARVMGKQESDRIKTRDGLSLPVLVTHPAGIKGPAPTVVLVHGGPWARGSSWGWGSDAQFLASRGYLVVEPEFRGSVGFGSKVFHSGWKQWGLTMQDDVADATTWAIDKGYTDPKRICIAGASYGGYATLMGLIRYPNLYRCGFEWVGVSDIELMYSISWSDSSESSKKFGMPIMIGDRVKDAKQLAETSPVKRAAEIKQPLLMAYGGRDKRVPIDHGTAMRDAMRNTNPNVEWVEYPLEGHGWARDDTNLDFWGRVERFLDKNLKNAP